MAEVGSRDRLVMAGLVVLGLLTVVAGVLSGHSTIDYVLGRDANEAALSWARQIDTALGGTAETPGRVLDKDFQVLDPASFQENLASMAGKPASLPANQSFSQRGFGLIEAIHRLTGGWANVALTGGRRDRGQAAMLKKWGCDQVQGFYYGKPDADVPESAEALKDRLLVA